MNKPVYRRWWFVVLLIVLLVATAVLVAMQTSFVLQEFVIDLVCSKDMDVRDSGDPAVLNAVSTLGTDVFYSTLPQSTMDVYAKTGEGPLPLVVYVHGGYYVSGDKNGFTAYCKTLAAQGFVVANVNYQLAPEGQFPDQLLQTDAAVAYLMENAQRYGIDPSAVFIAGDSAGGHLSSQMGLYYTNPAFAAQIGGTPALEAGQLRGVALLCGYYNAQTVRDTGFVFIADSIWMLTGEKDYEGTAVAALMSTVDHVTGDYPATFISCGDKDPFITQAEEMLRALEAKNVDTTAYLPESAGTPLLHEFQKNLELAEGAEAMEKLVDFLREHRG